MYENRSARASIARRHDQMHVVSPSDLVFALKPENRAIGMSARHVASGRTPIQG